MPACSARRWVRLHSHRNALRADSFLARLSDTEFDQGMAALCVHYSNINPNEAVTEEIDWLVFTNAA